MRRVPSERGFALPITIFIVTILTLLLTAAFVRVQADRNAADSSVSTLEALSVAHAGLRRYMSYYDSAMARPLDGDSLRVNVTSGYADVVAHLVHTPADTFQPHLYLVRSRGTVIEPTRGADPQAVRTAAQYARWIQGGIRLVAALTSINRTYYTAQGGTTVEVDGNDGCGGSPIMGFRASDEGAETSDVPGTVTGSPPMDIDDAWDVVADTVGINWAMIENGDFIPDYTAVIDGDTTFASYVLNSANLTDIEGTGLLIVKDKFDTKGQYFKWRGVILIGDDLDPDADSTIIEGLVVTGLDKLVGQSVSWNGFGDPNDNIWITFNDCWVQRAETRLRGFDPVRNAWVDNWATY
jgi:hypothetical protein